VSARVVSLAVVIHESILCYVNPIHEPDALFR